VFFSTPRVRQYNRPGFIEADPISIPHRFSRLQDIEISGFWAAMLAWGQRRTILNKCDELLARMDGAPYDFVRHHQEHDRRRFLDFKHRTFNATDTLYFLEFFQQYYRTHDTLETAFSLYLHPDDATTERALAGFHTQFFSLPDAPPRTRKHVATPARKSSCKRLNMFLRWMVRRDSAGVDFGCWTRIRPNQLVCPCDVHVERVARVPRADPAPTHRLADGGRTDGRPAAVRSGGSRQVRFRPVWPRRGRGIMSGLRRGQSGAFAKFHYLCLQTSTFLAQSWR
jgi:uncharacterized protein (TIGR02757 family)